MIPKELKLGEPAKVARWDVEYSIPCNTQTHSRVMTERKAQPPIKTITK